jgi:hypothetical protein
VRRREEIREEPGERRRARDERGENLIQSALVLMCAGEEHITILHPPYPMVNQHNNYTYMYSSNNQRSSEGELDPGSQNELYRQRRKDRVLKIRKLRGKYSSSSKHLKATWLPLHALSEDLHALNSSDSENDLSHPRVPGCGSEPTHHVDTSQLTRQERNRLSARASREKKNSEIVTLTSRVEFFKQQNQNLIAFLSQLPQSLLEQLQGSESSLLSLSSPSSESAPVPFDQQVT